MNRNQRRKSEKLLSTQVTHFAVPGANIGSLDGIAELSRRALQYHQAGKLVEAENCYRQVLAIEPDHFDSLHLLGVVAHQSGRNDLATTLIGKAIALSDRGLNDRKINSGLRSRRRKQPVGPRELAPAYSNLSIVLMSLDRPTEALRAIQRSLQLAETENTKLLFVQCLRALNSIPADVDFRDHLARALSEPWGRPIYLGKFAARVIMSDGRIAAHVRRFVAADTTSRPRQALIETIELADISSDRLLRTLLETTIVIDIDLERYLTAVRNTLLAMACGDAQPQRCDREMLRVFCALARQCFINEFIFACSNQEMELAERLRKLVTGALNSGEPIAELCLVALAAYCPLASLPAANLLAQRRWSDPVAQLVALQVREVEEERQLRASVPRLTGIEEASLTVRQQYEENPYPRWVKTSPVGQPTTIAAHLQEQFPLIDARVLPATESPEILIAGCGTGQHSIETARRFKGAQLLAIDLSLTSLCYAMRKTRELGLRNIEYAQADILRLGTLGRTFDIIEASGVLHHLAEPIAGWRILLSLLRPGGFMRLGLYSKLARRGLNGARAFIARRPGSGSFLEEIRLCRQELTRFGQNPALATVAEWGDFFSTSTCRDLLFHVKEHQTTLPEIGAILQQNRLQFLGFTLPRATQGNFKRRFPEDIAMTNLADWHIFESENPATFAEMYEFWIRKPA